MGVRYLVLGILIISVILVSGCMDNPEALVFSDQFVQNFLDQYPNARISVTHFSREESTNIIENITDECGNPYVNAKEYYRVTVDDPDSEMKVVVWIDWEAKKIECAVKYGAWDKIISVPGEGEKKCTPRSEEKCYNDNLYWYDSCENKEEKKEECELGCVEDRCRAVECQTHYTFRCHSGHIYWFDSCDNREDKKEYCEEGCEYEKCKEDCPPHQKLQCFGGHVYWYDGCGEREGMKEYCPNGCDLGSCNEYSMEECYDSDNGKNVSAKGTVVKANRIESDECKADGTLTEKYCFMHDIRWESVLCPSGQICRDGACIATGGCNDTDNGDNYFVRGSITLENESVMEDKCGEGFYEGFVIEYSCAAKSHVTNYECPLGCENGTCIKPECVDTDGGYNYFKKGWIVIKDGTKHENFCNGDNVVEQNCDKTVDYECPDGCSFGACVSGIHVSGECTDSDGGKNYYLRGTITTGNDTFEDGCGTGEMAGYVIEYSCEEQENGTHVPSNYECPFGCSEGRCKSSDVCSDTDGGKNFFQKGWIIMEDGIVREDECGTGNLDGYVIERHCESESNVFNYKCPNGCEEGACISVSA
ncbi:MAG: hypothetical protein JW754_06215 [Candidatus Aenigmarchaeota archaeon]|nr:hypothetical protein [Candidatus Aenigmarchaeota archaeon]